MTISASVIWKQQKKIYKKWNFLYNENVRKIQKILNTFKGLSCSVCLLVPTVLSSCTSSNNDHKKQDVTIFKNETIKQFWNLTTFGPHYSDISEEELQHGNLKAIKGYYKDLIKRIGLEWY